MTSAGLKRPSDFDLSPHQSGPSGSSPLWPVTNANKRRCTNFILQPSLFNTTTTGGHQNSPFRDSSYILNPLSEDVSSMIKNEVHRSKNANEPPVLTVRQTQTICEKIIKDREQKLREEYDKILISKLAEQHDTFVKYTHDHIEKRYNETNSHYQSSYLS